MGQGDIIEFLEKKKIVFTRGEIARTMNESPTKVSILLKKLADKNEIRYVEIDRMTANKRCGSRRRIKVYWIGMLDKDNYLFIKDFL